MSLPLDWIDKIFKKLTLAYGRDFLGRWEGLDIADVKTDWAHELAGFDQWPAAIAHALTHLPPNKPPTVYEFRELARKAPITALSQLEAPKADRERVAAELAKLARMRNQGRGSASDGRDWARSNLARYEAGEPVSSYSLRLSREALGMA